MLFVLILFTVTGLLLLAEYDKIIDGTFTVTDIFYESLSALSTAGVSSARTRLLSRAGHLIVLLGMGIGRVGPFTMALMFAYKNKIKKQEEVLPEAETYIASVKGRLVVKDAV